MLLKALRTRDLRSYSLAHLVMSASANLLFWIYVVALPFGPVWILQIFFTVTDLSMLTLCVSQRHRLSQQEKRNSVSFASLGMRQGHSASIQRATHSRPMA